MPSGGSVAAQLAQTAAQTLTAWALLVHLMGLDPSAFTVAFAVAAFSLPLRHDGTRRDRAKTCFSASLVLAGLIGFELALGLLGGGVATEDLLLLTATVLYSVAGALYWVGPESGGGGRPGADGAASDGGAHADGTAEA
jgi:hypothetical protein